MYVIYRNPRKSKGQRKHIHHYVYYDPYSNAVTENIKTLCSKKIDNLVPVMVERPGMVNCTYCNREYNKITETNIREVQR